MQTKSRFTLVLIVLLVVCAIAIGLSRAMQGTAQQQPQPSIGSLRWHAQQAQASGDSSVTLIAVPHIASAASLDEAIDRHSIVAAQLIGQATVYYEDADNIVTWSKFRTVETLKLTDCLDCAGTLNPPNNLLPLQVNEFVVPIKGGSFAFDNVIETLKLKQHPNNQIADVMGPQGVVHVNSDNTFAPVFQLAPGTTEPVINGLATQYGNSLTQLRAALNPPTPCNPGQAQNCTDENGTWNSSNCTCTPAFDPCVRKPWLCE